MKFFSVHEIICLWKICFVLYKMSYLFLSMKCLVHYAMSCLWNVPNTKIRKILIKTIMKLFKGMFLKINNLLYSFFSAIKCFPHQCTHIKLWTVNLLILYLCCCCKWLNYTYRIVSARRLQEQIFRVPNIHCTHSPLLLVYILLPVLGSSFVVVVPVQVHKYFFLTFGGFRQYFHKLHHLPQSWSQNRLGFVHCKNVNYDYFIVFINILTEYLACD